MWRRCAQCGEVLGTYEPLLLIEDGVARRTSFAAEPELALASETHSYLHPACARAVLSEETYDGGPA